MGKESLVSQAETTVNGTFLALKDFLLGQKQVAQEERPFDSICVAFRLE